MTLTAAFVTTGLLEPAAACQPWYRARPANSPSSAPTTRHRRWRLLSAKPAKAPRASPAPSGEAGRSAVAGCRGWAGVAHPSLGARALATAFGWVQARQDGCIRRSETTRWARALEETARVCPRDLRSARLSFELQGNRDSAPTGSGIRTISKAAIAPGSVSHRPRVSLIPGRSCADRGTPPRPGGLQHVRNTPPDELARTVTLSALVGRNPRSRPFSLPPRDGCGTEAPGEPIQEGRTTRTTVWDTSCRQPE